jgi:hypothetical protein
VQRAVPAVLFLLASEFVVVDLVDRFGAGVTVAYATGLLVTVELLHWSAGIGKARAVERDALRHRATAFAAIAALGGLGAAAVVAASAVDDGQRVAGTTAGIAAACILLTAVLAVLGRFAGRTDPS